MAWSAFGNEPASVPESLIQEVQRRVEEGNAAGESSGLRHSSRVIAYVSSTAPLKAMRPSSTWTLAGKDRVQVLLSYLSQQPKRLIIEPEQIQKIEEK